MEVKEGREAAKLPPSHHLKLSRSLSKDGGNLMHLTETVRRPASFQLPVARAAVVILWAFLAR